ncbi:MAG: cupin domain-containing protein [Planctomycetaceae bacterium]
MAEPQRKAAFVPSGSGAPLAWFGETLRYLVVGEQTEGRLALSARTIPVGGGTGPQVLHRTHVGYFVVAGELTVSVGNRNLILPAGGYLGVAPGTVQKLVNAGHEPAEIYTFIGPAGLDEFHFRSGVPLASGDAPVPAVSDDDRETLASLAPGYGIDLHPPDVATRAEPNLRLTLPGEGRTLAVVGDLYRFLAVSEDTGGRYALFHATVPPGNGPPWHTHSREDEFFIVLKGRVSFQVDGTVVAGEPGGFVHLPSGVRHRFENESAGVAEMLILTAPAGLEKLFDAVGRRWHDPSVPPGPPERADIERLIEESQKYGVELFF